MNKRRVLLARPDDDIRAKFREGLEACGFEVFSASSVSAALGLISIQKFDVLVSGLHLPNPGDGFTVVNAMRHTHPAAVIVVVSGHPAIREAYKPFTESDDRERSGNAFKSVRSHRREQGTGSGDFGEGCWPHD